MSWRTPDGKFRKPKEVDSPPVSDLFNFPEHWKNKTISYLGDKKYFDQDVRTGECFFCKREGRVQKSKITNLHHVKYDHSDPLSWTIEVCKSCHWQIDEKNRKVIARSTGREIKPRRQPYYENREQRMKREERDREDWYKSFCWNLNGKFVPNEKIIPDKETYDKVIEAIKKASSKRNSMSSVAHRYY